VAGRWFSLNTAVSSTSTTDRNDITEILLKVLLNTILTLTLSAVLFYFIGSVLIYEHDILHEGSIIKSGRKYLLRTDVMYSSNSKTKKSKLNRFLHLFKT
jgi:hypothetical protein